MFTVSRNYKMEYKKPVSLIGSGLLFSNSCRFSTLFSWLFHNCVPSFQGPHSHILMMGEGGEGPSDFFGSEIVAKSNFFGSMKCAGIFLGREKKTEGFFGLPKKGLRDFWG